ncbi:YqeB family protein [Streptomyces sp. NPDC002851]
MTAEPHVGKVTRKATEPGSGPGVAGQVGLPAQTLGPPPWLAPAFALCGAVAGPLVALLAHVLLKLPWAPFEGPARLLASVPQPWLTIGTAAVGAAAGLVVGLIAVHEELGLRVTPDATTLTRGDVSREVARADVALVARDGKQLVLLGPGTEELAREECDLNGRRLAEAFDAHGWPWADADPHREAFRLWVPDLPGLPDGADALLKARARALKRTGAEAEVRELRAELARLGVYVRDEKSGGTGGRKQQYWRRAVES